MDLSELDGLREEYESAQDVVDSKRESYHAAIRRLYMSGVSLREIADHLGISHQRIHTIVGLEPPKRKRSRGQIIASLIVVVLLCGMGLLLIPIGVVAGPDLSYSWIAFSVKDERQVRAITKRLESDARVAIWDFEPFSESGGFFVDRGFGLEHPEGGNFSIRPKSPIAGFEINREYGSIRSIQMQSHREHQLSPSRVAAWGGALAAFAAGIFLVVRVKRS